jgi:hypothetical protein
MLKQTITYTDFNDDEATDTLYFNITKTELTDRMDLAKEFTEIQASFAGELRELTSSEVRRILELVKLLIKISYGERSIDGKRFAKSEEAYVAFTQTAAYDAFLFSLFEDPQKAISFILGIFPADLRKEAETTVRTQQPELFIDPNAGISANDFPTAIPADIATRVSQEPEDYRPAWIREDRDPNRAELTAMSKEEIQAEFLRKMASSQSQ